MLALFALLIYIDGFARFALLTLLALLALLCIRCLFVFRFVSCSVFALLSCLLSLLNCLVLPFIVSKNKTDVQGLTLGYILKHQALFVNA